MSSLHIRGLSKGHLLATLFSAGLIMSLLATGLIGIFTDNTVRTLEFSLRSSLKKSPEFDPRLKIYSFDDATVGYLNETDLNITTWVDVMEALAATHPKKIMIDKIFASLKGRYSGDELRARLKKIDTDLVMAAYTTPNPLRKQQSVPPAYRAFELTHWLTPSSDPVWIPIRPSYVYGPDSLLVESGVKLGHIVYRGLGRVDAFLRYDQIHAVPHWSFLAADQLLVRDDGLTINGQDVALQNAQIPVNFLDRDRLENHIYSMTSLISKVRKGSSLSEHITADQVVIILPSMYTGNADMVETPLGTMPGAYVIVSMVNSILTGQWIRSIPDSYYQIAGFALLGLLLVYRFHFVWSCIGLGLGTASIAAAGLFAFAMWSIQLPWLSSALAFTFSGLMNIGWSAFERLRKAQKITQAIAGLVPTEQIDALLEDDRGLHFEPSGHVVSIMFVDIVGFSITAKKLSPKETFDQLKTLLNEITAIAHSYQGTIDKTLGDGLLCFFGYDILGQTIPHHADMAVKCAMEIQRHIFQRSSIAFEQGLAVYPLRIGINTASVYIGNIGNSERFDFTMVGDGVNFAARLETACAPFKIMIGPATKAQLLDFSPQHPCMQKRYVMVKHTSELLEAWQVDPFHTAAEDVQKLQKLYWAYAGLDQREQRYSIHIAKAIKLECSLGHFQLVNYSLSGLGLRGDIFLAQGVVFTLAIDSADLSLKQDLNAWGLGSLIVEVCWGAQSQAEFEHGVRFVGLNQDQKARVFELIHRQMQGHGLVTRSS